LQQQFEDDAAVIGLACGEERLLLLTVVDFDFLLRVIRILGDDLLHGKLHELKPSA
jgi:hypothetical protein